jgi:hypothetical protein
MAVLKARVKNGRLVLDLPTDLPEGTVVTLEARQVDAPSPGIRASLADMIDESYADDDSGNVEIFPGTVTKPTER